MTERQRRLAAIRWLMHVNERAKYWARKFPSDVMSKQAVLGVWKRNPWLFTLYGGAP